MDVEDILEDEDTREERKVAMAVTHPQNTYPLVIKDIRKEYTNNNNNKKVAVK